MHVVPIYRILFPYLYWCPSIFICGCFCCNTPVSCGFMLFALGSSRKVYDEQGQGLSELPLFKEGIWCLMHYANKGTWTNADKVAQDQAVYLHSLIWELHFLLICQWNPVLQKSKQLNSQIRLCRCQNAPFHMICHIWQVQKVQLLGNLLIHTVDTMAVASVFAERSSYATS